MNEWTLESYIYRREVKVQARDFHVPELHPITVRLPISTVQANKIRGDLSDIEVVFADSAIYRDVSYDSDFVYVTFQAQQPVPPGLRVHDYKVYMGNPTLMSTPVRADYIETDYYPDPFYDSSFMVPGVPQWANWPNSILYNNTLVSYTRPGEHWIDGYTEVPQARASTKLIADRIRLICEKGPDQGIIQVSVNGQSWNEVDLYSDNTQVVPVFVVSELPRRQLNELTVIATGRSRYGNTEFRANIQRIDYNYDFLARDIGEEIMPLSWSSYVGGS